MRANNGRFCPALPRTLRCFGDYELLEEIARGTRSAA
jgi:hypothetical protein